MSSINNEIESLSFQCDTIFFQDLSNFHFKPRQWKWVTTENLETNWSVKFNFAFPLQVRIDSCAMQLAIFRNRKLQTSRCRLNVISDSRSLICSSLKTVHQTWMLCDLNNDINFPLNSFSFFANHETRQQKFKFKSFYLL